MLAEAVGADLLSATLFELALKPLYRGAASYVARDDNSTNRAIRPAAKGLSELPVDAACPPEVWSRFLTSLDVRTLLQDLFMFRLDPQDPSVTEIGVAFGATWEAFADREGVPPTAVDIGAIFDVLADNAVTVLKSAVRDDVLAAHEAQSVARHQIVEARTDVIARLARAAAQGPALTPTDSLRLKSGGRSPHEPAGSSPRTCSVASGYQSIVSLSCLGSRAELVLGSAGNRVR